MIRSFRDVETKNIAEGQRSRYLPQGIQRTAARKLAQLHAAIRLTDLALPGNHLEALKRDRQGQHSIRINKQWRVCFRWTEEGPEAVEIVDYH